MKSDDYEAIPRLLYRLQVTSSPRLAIRFRRQVVESVVTRLMSVLKQIPNALDQPAPRVEILTIGAAGPVFTVRPYCRNEHYWQVYFDTNRAINQVFVAGTAQ